MGVLPALCIPLLASACGDLFRHQTASLGGETAGSRGTVRVLFLNNTDFQAVFTFGTYDPADRLTEPDFAQFGVKDRESTLDGGETSEILSLRCGRVFSIGSSSLLATIPDETEPGTISDEALREGVVFFDLAEGDADPVEIGTAPPLEARIGVDFGCGSLLVVYLEPADVGEHAFRIDFNVIPSASTR